MKIENNTDNSLVLDFGSYLQNLASLICTAAVFLIKKYILKCFPVFFLCKLQLLKFEVKLFCLTRKTDYRLLLEFLFLWSIDFY